MHECTEQYSTCQAEDTGVQFYMAFPVLYQPVFCTFQLCMCAAISQQYWTLPACLNQTGVELYTWMPQCPLSSEFREPVTANQQAKPHVSCNNEHIVHTQG